MSLLAHFGRTGANRLAPAGARALAQAEQFRQFAAAPTTPAQDDDDIVLTTFRKSQQQYQQLMKGLENINLPLTGDDAAIRKYAADVEALKKQIGMPDVEEVISAELDYKFACSGYDVRAFVSAALEGMGSLGGSLAAAKADVMAAVDAAEKAGGGELDPSNEKGWQVLTSKLQEIESKYGLGDRAKVRDDAIFDMYKSHISNLREEVLEGMNKARADGTTDMADIQPDLSKLKPKLV
ncbi:putative ATP synthase 24 kDa mitochondrial [Micractinium conductrix]|uniref:ATP synthase 24 kDa mitochondrial n=1 Tax=Micractinium conductrix TaxID=554055 RepID=A0A2P6V2P9_9CHLO|nr:putative ATP synthase 24 kDa mitochondrial [Micractinium conductrix]|eukprot:PSC68360.1 putative ATP synthase 24 kDa mitochondrial [Micractinium conductrix]